MLLATLAHLPVSLGLFNCSQYARNGAGLSWTVTQLSSYCVRLACIISTQVLCSLAVQAIPSPGLLINWLAALLFYACTTHGCFCVSAPELLKLWVTASHHHSHLCKPGQLQGSACMERISRGRGVRTSERKSQPQCALPICWQFSFPILNRILDDFRPQKWHWLGAPP